MRTGGWSHVVLIVAGLGAGACQRDAGAPEPAQPVTFAPPATMAVSPASAEQVPALGYAHRTAAAPAAGGEPAKAPAIDAPPAAAPLKLVRTAQLALEVASYEKAADAVRGVAEANGGYLADARAARGAHDQHTGSITVRVPAERFAPAVAALKALGKVRSETIAAQDVTKAYADLETRLAVKREAAARVRDILKTRTADLSDVLEAERELARLTEQIEQMEGERRYYDHLIALSTITVALEEPGPAVTASVFEPIGEALHDSAEVLARSIAGLVYVTVFLTPWLLVAVALWRVIRSVRARARRTPPPPTTTSGDTPGGPA